LKIKNYERDYFHSRRINGGGYETKVLGHSIFTEGDTIEELKQNIREAIHCHFETNAPSIVRFHYIKT